MKIKGTLINKELYLNNKDLITYIEKEIYRDSIRKGKTNSEFAKIMLRLLNKYEEQLDIKE